MREVWCMFKRETPVNMEDGNAKHDGIVSSNVAIGGRPGKASKGAQESAENNRRRAVRFKSLHLLVVGFFLWILLVTILENRYRI